MAGLPVDLDAGEALLQICDYVGDVLDADGQADGRRRDAAGLELRLGHLGMRGRCRVDDQRLDVGYVSQQREQLQGLRKAGSLRGGSVQIDGEDRAGSVREVALVEGVVAMRG